MFLPDTASSRGEILVSYSAVARESGLSVSTVSRFLKGEMQLRPETRDKIFSAMRALNYSHTPEATQTGLYIIVPEMANPYFGALAEALSDGATARGLDARIIISGGNTKRETDIVTELSKRDNLYGVCYVGMSRENPHLDELAARFPVVVVDEPIDRVEVDSLPFVGADNFSGAFAATNYLISMGHNRISHVGGPTDLISAQERQRGYESALTANGIAVDPSLILRGPYSESYGASVLTQFKQLVQFPTAAFVSSDFVAIGLISAADQYGIRIPQDLSLVGFDGIRVGAWLRPQLTTVAQPISEMVNAAFAELNVLHTGRAGTDRVLPMELMLRESVLRLGD